MKGNGESNNWVIFGVIWMVAMALLGSKTAVFEQTADRIHNLIYILIETSLANLNCE